MPASLPSPGASSNVWATLLNAFLNVAHNTDGTIKGGGTIGFQSYGPAGQVTYNALVTSYTAMDTTNLTLTVTVPATGNFYVDVGADWAFQTTTGLSFPIDMFIALVLHNTTTLICPAQSWIGANQTNQVSGAHHIHRYYVTGQTPQSTLQFDLAMGVNATTDISFANFYAVSGTQALSTDPAGPITIHAFAM